MASRFDVEQPDFKRLKSALLTSGLQQKDNALYQVINGLLDQLSEFQAIVNGDIAELGGKVKNFVAGSNIQFQDLSGRTVINALVPFVSDGEQGEDGVSGIQGKEGPAGPVGPMGPPGIDAEEPEEPAWIRP